MHSHRTLIIVCLVVAAVAIAAGYWLRGNGGDDAEPTPTPSVTPSPVLSSSPAATAAAAPRTHTVRLTQSGVNPKSLTVAVGDSVTFINDSGPDFWVASDPHPSHGLCPGFDARRGLRQGESYTLAFNTRATCTYHNHLDAANSGQRGTVTVQ